jgi:filamentous hemagglutinin family protein
MIKTRFLLSFFTLTSLLASLQTAQAQTYQPSNRTPVADNTLGTQVSGNGNNFSITGGVTRGQTLFHSFTDFSVPTNGQANFLNPVGNRDIITRVTGGAFSDINGLLNSNGANFFLINPNGIVFGTNAQLNVGRAFMASTASGIELVDGGGRAITFGTSSNGDAPLLSVAPNVLFNVSRLNLGGGGGQISNFGTLQTTNPNQYISLIGGNVTMNGGQINAPGGRVELGGLSTVGTIALGTDINNPKAQFPTNVVRGNVSLINRARINVAGFEGGGGDIAINAGSLSLLDGVELSASTFGKGDTGNIEVNVTGSVTLVGANIFSKIESLGEGKGSTIDIKAGSLSLANGSQLDTSTSGKGDAGNINVIARDGVSLIGSGSKISSNINTGGAGQSGDVNINVTSGSLSLVNAAQIETSISGNGNAGDVNITAKNGVFQTGSGGSKISSRVNTEGAGKSGNVNINVTSGSLSLANAAQIETSISGKGEAGNINITVKENAVSLADSSKISSSVNTGGEGKIGNINVTSGSLSLTNAAQIDTSTSGNGDAGSVNVNAKDAVFLAGSSKISSSLGLGANGVGGNINIQAGSLLLTNGSQLEVSTSGNGDAGNVNLNVKDTVSITDLSKINSSVNQGAEGNGGLIGIKSGSVSLTNGAQLTASTLGLGIAGNINIDVKDNIYLSGSSNSIPSGLFVSSRGTGITGDINLNAPKIVLDNGATIEAFSRSDSAGNINIGDKTIANTDLLLLRRGSKISTNAEGSAARQGGNGGNININSKLIVAVPNENSDITANAIEGRGGNVNINSQGLFGIQFRPRQTDNNDITASSEFNQQGTVDIKTPGTDPGKDSIKLPNTTTDASNQISQVCSTSNRQNQFTVAGRGGLPPNANDPLTSDVIWQDARAASNQPVATAMTNPVTLAPPAVGWVFDGKGKVTLVAAGTQGQPTGTSVVCPNIKEKGERVKGKG